MTLSSNEKIAKPEIRKDILGRELNIDDVVVFNPPKYKGIILGKIIRFTPKGIRVQFRPNHWAKELSDTALDGSDVIKIDGPEATLYILKNGGLSK